MVWCREEGTAVVPGLLPGWCVGVQEKVCVCVMWVGVAGAELGR